jgi:hypothetical protein
VRTDTLKVVFTYFIAIVDIVAGFWFLYATRSEENIMDIRLAVVGFITAALTWVFQSETATRTARQTERALLTNPSNGKSQEH